LVAEEPEIIHFETIGTREPRDDLPFKIERVSAAPSDGDDLLDGEFALGLADFIGVGA